MAIYTGRGLKIHLPVDYSFALMQRLYPAVDVFKVFRTTEGLELLPSCMVFIATILCFKNHASPTTIAIVVTTVHLGSHIMRLDGSCTGAFILQISKIYSVLHGYCIYIIILLLVGFYFVGWQGLLAYVAGYILGSFLNYIFRHFNKKYIQKKYGFNALTLSEINFLNAYLFHAKRQNKSLDLNVTDDELVESNWKPVFMDLKKKWPEIVAQFT